jgi:hypothetical protein
MNHYLLKIKTIKKIRADEHFTAREFSNRYTKRHLQEMNHEQYAEGEGIDAPWVHGYGSVNGVLSDLFKEIKLKLAIPKGQKQEPDVNH